MIARGRPGWQAAPGQRGRHTGMRSAFRSTGACNKRETGPVSHGIDRELFACLTDAATYGADGARVEVVETHAACVFLCGQRALKVKKNVTYPYLDFSSSERRAHALRREYELNRGNAPELYLGLVSVVRRQDGRLALGGEGEIVETALEMRRFDQDLLLDRLARHGKLEAGLMNVLALTIMRAHQRAPVSRRADQHSALARVADGNVASLAAHSELFAARDTAGLAGRWRAELARCAKILRERTRSGHVRRCHGDLHLGNIVLWRGQPTLFDALEFDEELATIDVFYDLSFVLMDLAHRGLVRHASVLLNSYLARLEPAALAGLAALPLMASLRAAIRAKVEADRAAGLDVADQKSGAEAAARSYLDLALRALAPSPLRLIAVGGLSGSGKSTLARRLAAAAGGVTGAVLLRSDVERKAMAGAAESDRLGEESYAAQATRVVYDRLRRKAGVALGARTSVIVDAVHARPAERQALARIARKASARFDGLWLEAAPDVLISRVAARTGDASDADGAVVERQLAHDPGQIGWTRIDAGGGPDETWRRACDALGLDA